MCQWLNVLHLPRDMIKAVPELGIELHLTGDSASCSQQTIIHLGLPGLTVILPHHWNQLTGWWLVDSFAPPVLGVQDVRTQIQ